MRCPSILAYLFLFTASFLHAQDLPSIAEKTTGFEQQDGFFPVYWDAAGGKVWLEINQWDTDFLYVSSLPAGLGSNDIGLDRGQLGGEHVVRFERVGPKVLMIARNLDYRADTDHAAERKAVRDAFAESVLFGFKAEAETEGRVLVDATAFMVRDAHGIVRRLKNTNQGTFRLDADRSAPYPSMTKAFPDNTELEARITFTGEAPGRYVWDVAANPYSFTVRIRHSLVRPPDDNFEPRTMHPQSGYYPITYVDYATPIGSRKEKQLIRRHRLQKKNPGPAPSEPVEPIVYYLDPGTPEPIRSALLDGARWWNQAFEAAGFINGYRVEMLPEDADPMDVRYNVIQWVHRATRGWSYGSSVTDPRTGEIIKGHVSLGSLRVRQDYLIAEGLLAPYGTPETTAGLPADQDPMLEMALARIRQLSAHEVGHTLGIAHNFAASTNDRASVMDYPAPLATVAAGNPVNLDEAYAVGIGDWDKQAVKYGYGEFEDEATGLAAVLAETRTLGLRYITDNDARPFGGAHPQAHLWDNGTDPVAALENEMAVRQKALGQFGPNMLREGMPFATLEEVLVPLYLRHRYQLEAVVKLIGGMDYTYASKGDGLRPTMPVPDHVQERALDALLQTVTPAALRLPDEAHQMIAPRPPGFGQNRELFDGHTGLTFDAYAPAQTVADMVFGLLAHPERAARLVYQQDGVVASFGLQTLLERTTEAVMEPALPNDPVDAELQRLAQRSWVNALLRLGASPNAAPAVRALTHHHLKALPDWLAANPGTDIETLAHRNLLHADINRLLNRPFDEAPLPKPLVTPPGSPIGH